MMKNRFPGYFRPSQAEFDQLWKSGLVVPDTNILLHLFRYGKSTREEVVKSLRAFGTRVWVPYQVGFEFIKRWRDVDSDNRGA